MRLGASYAGKAPGASEPARYTGGVIPRLRLSSH
jgi:hypothetical protein